AADSLLGHLVEQVNPSAGAVNPTAFPILALVPSQGFRVDVDDEDSAGPASRNSNQRIRPTLPPFLDLLGIGSGVLEPVGGQGSLVRACRENGCVREVHIGTMPDWHR